jgi:hypothetical protein
LVVNANTTVINIKNPRDQGLLCRDESERPCHREVPRHKNKNKKINNPRKHKINPYKDFSIEVETFKALFKRKTTPGQANPNGIPLED